jgi:hypothetical protein
MPHRAFPVLVSVALLLLGTRAQATRDRNNDLMRIVSPTARGTVPAHPFVNVIVSFGATANGALADPSTFRARIGNKEIPRKLDGEGDQPNVFLPVKEGDTIVGFRARLESPLVRVGKATNRLQVQVRSLAEEGRARRGAKRDVDRVRFRATEASNQAPSGDVRPLGAILPGIDVALSADAIDPELDNLTYLWDFGDGTTSSSQRPEYSFPNAQTDVTVRLTLSDGQSATELSEKFLVCPPLDDGHTPGVLNISGNEHLEFGSVPLGSAGSKTLTVTNGDAGPASQIRLRFGIDTPGFAVTPSELTLGPSESQPLTVTFTPTAAGHSSAKVAAVACAANVNAVQLLAHGVGGTAPGPTFAGETLFFTDAVPGLLGTGTFGILPSGQRIAVDSTASVCQAPENGAGTGDLCLSDRDCINGGTCLKSSTCIRGEREGQPCTKAADCPAGFCPSQTDFDPLDMCSDGQGSLFLLSDEGTFTDLNPVDTELSGTVMRVDFDPSSGARTGAEIIGRSTTQTSWMACDRIPGQNGGRVFLAEYHDVFGMPGCFRDGRESLTVLRKRSGVRTVLASRIDAAEGLDECRDDYEPVEDLQVSSDGVSIFASLSTGLFRVMPTPLQITPDFNELFQLHPDGSVVIATATDQGSVGLIRVYKIAPEQAVNGAVRLASTTPCATLSVPNNGGRTVINYPTALGRAATGGSDATLVVSFLTTGGTSDRTGRPPVLSSKLRFQGTAAFSVPAGGSLCPSLGILNLDLMELLTF